MKFLHLSDLHLGKRLHECSLLEDQEYILMTQILGIVREEQPDGVLLAGDIYDKSAPSAEAVALCDRFLVTLSELVPHSFLLSGNHDSAERLAFGGRLMERSGIHISPVYGGTLSPITLEDGFGPVHVYLLPFLKPAQARRFFPDEEISSEIDAVRAALAGLPLEASERNVLVAHQFITGGMRCDSEELSVGGSGGVDAAVFDGFDYVALGHLHGPQRVERETLRYCGSPLKYSFSEARQVKSITVVELAEKGSVMVRTVPLVPLRDLREIRGKYLELTAQSYYEGTSLGEDYLHITLTDEEDVPQAIGRLRAIYHNLLKLDYDNIRTRMGAVAPQEGAAEKLSPHALFAQFYESRNGRPMTNEQTALVTELVEKIWGEDAL